MCFSLDKNCKLKVKLWWAETHKRKKRVFFVTFILTEGNFFNICVLSHCLVYWIYFKNINTFTYQKTLLHPLLLLVFKFVESLQCILIYYIKQVVGQLFFKGKNNFMQAIWNIKLLWKFFVMKRSKSNRCQLTLLIHYCNLDVESLQEAWCGVSSFDSISRWSESIFFVYFCKNKKGKQILLTWVNVKHQ